VTSVTTALTTATTPATPSTTPITRNVVEPWRQHGTAIAMHAAPTRNSITAVTEVTMPEATG
jgi:Tfp pilus assembly major pilin PilA